MKSLSKAIFYIKYFAKKHGEVLEEKQHLMIMVVANINIKNMVIHILNMLT